MLYIAWWYYYLEIFVSSNTTVLQLWLRKHLLHNSKIRREMGCFPIFFPLSLWETFVKFSSLVCIWIFTEGGLISFQLCDQRTPDDRFKAEHRLRNTATLTVRHNRAAELQSPISPLIALTLKTPCDSVCSGLGSYYALGERRKDFKLEFLN